MADAPNYLDPAVLAQLEGLQLRAARIVEGYVSGLHRSPYQGFSVEFAEHREYAPGDDLRYVDWKVFGKTDKVYLKQYEEETNLICYLVLDISESMQYRSELAPLSKLEYAQSAAAALAYLVIRQQDSVGLVTFDDAVRQIARPSSSASHLSQLVRLMEMTSAEKKTRTGPIFHELAERFTRRGIVFVLSDLFDDPEELLAGLKHFRHRRHDVVVLHTFDPAELDFPFQHATMFHGLEGTGDLLVEPAQLRRAYQQEINRFANQVRTGCLAQGADYVQLRTDMPLSVALSTYLSHRRRRVR
ncbi:DUF58 domain-containing protein [Aeoliella mucimassa]|uniref:DUF58 domain-containing protein n=1 Tax=Aeoliella mucimassa TaxID=2527972 RepID=A0A518AJU9_9BACT|nr:DUF58 domain-containing protein [Aeoliella mucimassa]QDU55000.1 hypothetical protein Pan181_11850 [Aeoliella mucimassa]